MVAASRVTPARTAAALFPQSDLRRGRLDPIALARAPQHEGSEVQDRTKQRDHSFIDPNNEPIRVVDVVSFHRPVGGKLDVTLCAAVHRELNGDRTSMANVVTARLRLDLGMARAIIDGLTKQIAMAEAAEATQN